MQHQYLCILFFILLVACNDEQAEVIVPAYEGAVSEDIHLNQVGVYPGTTLRFSVVAYSRLGDTLDVPLATTDKPASYYVTSPDGLTIVSEGQLGKLRDWTELAGVKTYYTEVAAPADGEYRIYVPGYGFSHEFAVKEEVYREALIASMRSNFLQRMGKDLLEEHAGVYARTAGHPDDRVRFHPSSGRTGATASPGGWYDAGDYNKYVVNGAFPLGQYLALQEDVGTLIKDGELNIPESGNGVDDYLDELRYELEWLLTMQDEDGGAFHKVTTLAFEGMVMPKEATSQRYMVGKSTEATLNLAAALAQANRVFLTIDPPFAAQLVTAAEAAWVWAERNPERGFVNPEDVSTGEYGDKNWRDERAFAAAELYLSTQRQSYLDAYLAVPPQAQFRAGGSWRTFMGKLAMFSLLRFPDRIPVEVYESTMADVIAMADSIVGVAGGNAYDQPITRWNWGSNSDVLNAAMIVAVADQLNSSDSYREFLHASVDFILGHNPTGYSFLTGFGGKTPMHIHHRPSMADDIAEPFPGFLSGGPNPGRQDSAYTTYPKNAAPMQSWTDQDGSFASNEICLNWNAPLTYVLGYLEATE